MTITVALERSDLGPVAVPIELGDPTVWLESDAREFLHALQRLLGGGGIYACNARCEGDRARIRIEVTGVGGRVTTPLLNFSEAAATELERLTFELPRP